MLTLDPRAGSGTLLHPLRLRHIPVESKELTFGDAAWFGNGRDSFPVHVGVEVKRVTDVLQCIHDNRFSGHQLPGLLRMYDVVILLVEGNYRPGKQGLLELPVRRGKAHRWVDYATLTGSSRQFMWRDLQRWIATMRHRVGITVERTYSHDETAEWLAAEYTWWQGRWERHDAYKGLYVAKDVGVGDGAAEILGFRPNQVGMVAATLPGIGYERARQVQRCFKSVRELVGAKVEEWASIDGIGKVTATRVVAALGGE